VVSNKLPVEAYPAEYLAFLKKAALGRVEIRIPNTTPGKSRAWYVAQRINQLRAAMKREQHPDYDFIAKASVLVRKTDDPNISLLIGQPRDVDVTSAFKDAGIEAPRLFVDPLATAERGGRPMSIDDLPVDKDSEE
jgi:hypothetical protein